MLTTRLHLARILVVGAAASGFIACHKKDEQAPPPKPEVSITTATVSEEPIKTVVPGRLEAYRQAEVRARAAGVIIERKYEEGQQVKKGTTLFRIDPAPLKAAYNMAEGQLASAKANHVAAADKLKRYEELLKDRAVSELEYTAAVAEEGQLKAAVASATAAQQSAKLNLDYTNVTSPIDGRARRALVTEGAMVGLDSPTPLTTVEQIDPIYVTFSQPAAEVLGIRRAARNGKVAGIPQNEVAVNLVLADGTEYSRPGKLIFNDLAVDPATDTVTMRALFPNPEGELLPGGYVNVRMVNAVNKSTVLVPRNAVVRSLNKANVMIVGPDDKIQSVEVKAETMNGQNWVVTDGLKGGERIVLSNPGMLMVGTEVKPVDKANPVAKEEEGKKAPQSAVR